MTETDTINKFKDGDVFRWSYREIGDDRQYGRYHCCSRIAIAKGGRLRDTYWFSGDGRSFGEAELPKLALEYLGNLADLERVAEYNAVYYDDADIVDINHANSSRDNFYIRKGASRSVAKMLQVARYNLERAESDQRSAARRAELYREAIAAIESGDTSVML